MPDINNKNKTSKANLSANSNISGNKVSNANSAANGNKANSSKPSNPAAEISVLKELYNNTDTAKISVDNVLKKIEDTTMRNLLLSHYESYNEMSNKISMQLTKNGETPKEGNVFGKAMLWGSINMNTLFDKTPSHIADIMIQGNNMGIISINKELNSCTGLLSEDTKQLAAELLSLQQKNVEDLKAFL